MDTNPHSDEALRRRAVALAVALTADTPLAPKHYERQLLARYQRGELSIEAVERALAASVHHVFYCSQAVPAPSQAQLDELLAWSRLYNAQHGLTGLLLYSDGRFVQLLEGPEREVRALFANIQRDPRHGRLITLSDGPGPQRWFADWSMAFGHVDPLTFNHALGALAARAPVHVPVDDPHLQTLLDAFGGPTPDLT